MNVFVILVEQKFRLLKQQQKEPQQIVMLLSADYTVFHAVGTTNEQ